MLLHFLLGCVATELSQSWQLDRLRVLGAQVIPAEPKPNEAVSFTSLVYTPYDTTLGSVILFACLPETSSGFGCTIDPNLFSSFETMDDLPLEEQMELFTELQASGFAGVEPELPLGWTVPEDALDNLSEEEREEGVSALLNLTAIPSDGNASTSAEDIENGDVELAYKRFPVSESTSPNKNPKITSFLIDETVYTEDDIVKVSAGGTYTIEPQLSENSVEEYSYTTPDGISETRSEEPYFLWYAEGGWLLQPFSLYPFGAEWTAPEKDWSGKLIVVVRDRRGGIDWFWINVEVEQ
jgi:hypothetical protein